MRAEPLVIEAGDEAADETFRAWLMQHDVGESTYRVEIYDDYMIVWSYHVVDGSHHVRARCPSITVDADVRLLISDSDREACRLAPTLVKLRTPYPG